MFDSTKKGFHRIVIIRSVSSRFHPQQKHRVYFVLLCCVRVLLMSKSGAKAMSGRHLLPHLDVKTINALLYENLPMQ